MTTLYLRKLYNSFVPADEISATTMEGMAPNAEFKAELTRPRNMAYHRRFFALLQVAFDSWEQPVIEHKGRMIEKNFARFRKDLTILCGHYETVVNIKGELRLEAKSISFASMDQEAFEKLYSTAIDAILKHILTNYTADDLNEQVDKILEFS
jgi:hypothetical protein